MTPSNTSSTTSENLNPTTAQCAVCGRRFVDPMTLNSWPIDRTLCYSEECGDDPRCVSPDVKIPRYRLEEAYAETKDNPHWVENHNVNNLDALFEVVGIDAQEAKDAVANSGIWYEASDDENGKPLYRRITEFIQNCAVKRKVLSFKVIVEVDVTDCIDVNETLVEIRDKFENIIYHAKSSVTEETNAICETTKVI